MGGYGSKCISVLPTATFAQIMHDKKSQTAALVRTNIHAGYLYLVLPPNTTLNNFEKFGYKLILHLAKNDKDLKLESVCIDNSPGIHIIKEAKKEND